MIHSPPGTAVLDDHALLIQANVPDLSFARDGAMINSPVHHHATPDSTPKRYIEDRVRLAATPFDRLGQSGGVGIVVDAYRDTRMVTGPADKVEVSPTFNMMRDARLAGAPINRTPETDPNRRDAVLVLELVNGVTNLAQNAFGTAFLVHLESAAIEDVCIVVPQNDLKLCAANLNSKIKPFVHKLRRRLAEKRINVMENI